MARQNPIKNSLILASVALVVVLLSVFVVKPLKEKSDKRQSEGKLLYGNLQRNGIIEFQFENPAGAVNVKKSSTKDKGAGDDSWLVSAASKTFEADHAAVDGLLSTILAAKSEQEVQNKDLAAMGLNPPKFKVRIAEGTETPKQELYLGEDTPVDYLVYAKWSDKPEIFLTSRSLRFGIEKKLNDLRNRKVFHQSLDTLSAVELHSTGHRKMPAYHLNFQKDAATKEWSAGGTAKILLDQAELEKFFGELNKVSVVNFASDADMEKRKKNPPTELLTLTLSGAQQSTPVKWVLDAVNDGAKGKFYFYRSDQEGIYEVSETFLDNFKKTLFDFRPKTIVPFVKGDIQFISINDGTHSVELSKNTSGAWGVKGNGTKGDFSGQAKADMVDKALTDLTGLKAVEFLDGQTPFETGLQRPHRVVELRGKKDGKDQTLTTLFFGKKLGANKATVRRQGMAAAAVVVFDLDGVLPSEMEKFLVKDSSSTKSDKNPKDAAASAANASGTRVKLEATAKSPKELKKLPAPIVKKGHKYFAEITMKKGGKIVIEFAADKAPYTVSNFIHLARNHFYDGTTFHRVIKGFVAQGGDPTGTGSGGPGWMFDNEDNDLKHTAGSISMAHAGRNTNGSQFFLVYEPQPHLDGVHTVFGKIIEGQDVHQAIQQGDVMQKVEIFEE